MNVRSTFALAVLTSALACGCQTDAACKTDPEFETARAAWKAVHPSDYRFVWQQSCFCLPEAVQPIVVTVRHGEIVSATNRDGVPVSQEVRENVQTIDALYQRIADAQCHAEEVRFKANERGVPDSIYIDPRHLVADDEYGVTISEFSIVR